MDYARALVEHPRWRWEPGMVVLDNEGAGEVFVVYRVMPYFRRIPAMGYCSATNEYTFDMPTHREFGTLPDINHPATKGWLLHMLREATGNQRVHSREALLSPGGRSDEPMGYVAIGGGVDSGIQATEGEALAAALLAVWGQAQTETPEHTKNCSRITGRLNHDVCPECRKEPA